MEVEKRYLLKKFSMTLGLSFLTSSPREGRKYVVVDEKEDLESEEEEEEKEIKRKHALFHQKQQRISKMQEIRRSMIAKLYQPRHPNMYPQMGMYTVDRHRFELDEKAVFDPSFLQAFHTRQWNSIIKKETATNIYSCPLFTMAFCTQFMEEIHHFRDESGLPMLRPNSMHHYGVLLSEMGFDPFLTVLRETYIKPLCQFLYGELGMQIDSNHAFVVEYKIGVDEKLDMQYLLTGHNLLTHVVMMIVRSHSTVVWGMSSKEGRWSSVAS